jgi:hypothetical protein
MAILRIKRRLSPTNPSVTRPNTLSNPAPSLPNTPVRGPRGRRSSALSAGLNVSALKAEMSTEIAMVSANCW